MVAAAFMITEVIVMVLLLKTACTDDGNVNTPESLQNAALFERFKHTYGRVYPDKEGEQIGFNNFVNNVAEVNRLNKEHPGRIIAFQLNRFADIDPADVKEHYGVQMNPYDNTEQGKNEAGNGAHLHKFLEDMHLYDLNQVDDLYHDWQKKWGKYNSTKKKKNMVSYYRFIKTVVETNQKKFDGEDVSLDKNADVVHEPNQYFYG